VNFRKIRNCEKQLLCVRLRWEKKVLFRINFPPTFSVMIFHFHFSIFHLQFFWKYFIILKKNSSSHLIFYKLKLRNFRQQIFKISFFSEKFSNTKMNTAQKRDKFSDKFFTQNFSSFHFQLSIFLAQLSTKIFSDFRLFNSSCSQRIFFRSNWHITFRRLARLGSKYTLTFRVMTKLCKYKTNFRFCPKPQSCQTAVTGSLDFWKPKFPFLGGWKISICGCHNSFSGCNISFCGYHISFCLFNISNCGYHNSFSRCYISFCG
jgi:hypothetical protein